MFECSDHINRHMPGSVVAILGAEFLPNLAQDGSAAISWNRKMASGEQGVAHALHEDVVSLWWRNLAVNQAYFRAQPQSKAKSMKKSSARAEHTDFRKGDSKLFEPLLNVHGANS